jgi:hypothetical protein
LVTLLVTAVFVTIICAGLFLLVERPFMRPEWHIRLAEKIRGWMKSKPAGNADSLSGP